MLAGLISMSYQKDEERIASLHQLSHTLDLLKVLIRLSKDTKAINLKQYTAIQKSLQEIGKMVGGWIKSVSC